VVSVIALTSLAACKRAGDQDTERTAANSEAPAPTVAHDSALQQQNAVLQAQKDSLMLATRGLLDAISAIDSATAKTGVKRAKGSRIEGGEPYEVGVRRRTLKALAQLRDANARLKRSVATVNTLNGQNQQLQTELATFRETATSLQNQLTIQQTRVDSLVHELALSHALTDSLTGRTKQLTSTVDSMVTLSHKVYVISGSKNYLLKNHIIDEVGGTRFPLIVKIGSTVRPSNAHPDTTLFHSFDMLSQRVITLDSTKKYEVVSTQDLSGADRSNAEGRIFRGSIKITDPERFWTPSAYLILRER